MARCPCCHRWNYHSARHPAHVCERILTAAGIGHFVQTAHLSIRLEETCEPADTGGGAACNTVQVLGAK